MQLHHLRALDSNLEILRLLPDFTKHMPTLLYHTDSSRLRRLCSLYTSFILLRSGYILPHNSAILSDLGVRHTVWVESDKLNKREKKKYIRGEK
jgi:hypothetical protein